VANNDFEFYKDENAFFRDYATSHKKLSELGFNPGGSYRSQLAKAALGMVIASTVVILGYLLELNKKIN
jgi:L-ascorbate peroxidase